MAMSIVPRPCLPLAGRLKSREISGNNELAWITKQLANPLAPRVVLTTSLYRAVARRPPDLTERVVWAGGRELRGQECKTSASTFVIRLCVIVVPYFVGCLEVQVQVTEADINIHPKDHPPVVPRSLSGTLGGLGGILLSGHHVDRPW